MTRSLLFQKQGMIVYPKHLTLLRATVYTSVDRSPRFAHPFNRVKMLYKKSIDRWQCAEHDFWKAVEKRADPRQISYQTICVYGCALAAIPAVSTPSIHVDTILADIGQHKFTNTFCGAAPGSI